MSRSELIRAVGRFPSLHSKALRYASAVSIIAFTTAASYLAARFLHFPQLFAFVIAVAMAALFGRGPAIAAVILATLASGFSPHPWLFAACYILTALLILAAVRLPTREGWDQKIRLTLFLLLKDFLPARVPEPGNGSHLLGRLDGSIDGEIYGWALDSLQSSLSPTLTVYLDGRPVGEMHAVHYRPDVDSHCFYFDLTRVHPANPAARVEVKFGSGQLLANSPLTVSIPAARAANLSPAVLFMHIAKTAGTTFREAMLENFRQSEVAYLYPDPPGFLTEDLGRLPLGQRAAFRLVVGHFQFGIHQFLPQPYTYITIVRDPFSRVISQYRYLLQQQGGAAHSKEGSPAHLIDLLERRERVTLDNYTVRCFSGVSEIDCPPGQVGREVYNLAVANLKTSFSFVGHQERSVEAYAALREMFHWKPRSRLEMINRGESPLNQGYEAIRAAIERFNTWDYALHSEIARLFP